MANSTALPPLFHLPEAAPTLMTSPEALGMREPTSTGEDNEGRSPPKGPIKRAVEKTVDKLGRSWSARVSQSPSPPPTSRSRIFNLSRRRKSVSAGDRSEGDTPPHSRALTGGSSHSSRLTSAGDDSPFIRPPSPTPLSGHQSDSFRGDGSMRMGTQTLIQALQAIPWTHDPDNKAGSSSESDSEEEDNNDARLASSIHTIHRPVARSRRASGPPSPTLSIPPTPVINYKAYAPSVPDVPEQESEGATPSEEELEPEDFEATSSSPVAEHSASLPNQGLSSRNEERAPLPPRKFNLRTLSMGTVKVQRRARLAEKLKEVFELNGIEEVWAEMPCWLLRSVLLQGYMYLTNTYICFFAHMPTKEDQVLKSGCLTKKANRTKRWIKHWFVLKNDALSWYHSSSDPYFPHGIVDLRYAISCEPLNEKEIRLRTNQKTILLSADSVPSREEWVKAIRKVIFKAQNMGDNVKIAIPYSAVLDVERSHAMDFSETIEVKVFDKEEPFSVDSYFFAYFHDLSAALDQIRDAVRMYRASPRAASSEIVLDTTHIRGAVLNPAPINVVDRTQSLPDPLSRFSVGVGGFSLTSLLRPFHDPGSPSRAAESPAHPPHDAEDFTHISKRSSFIPVTCSPSPMSPVSLSESQKTLEVGTRNTTAPASTTADHTYPPPSTPHDLSPSESTSGSYWSVGVPSWLKNPSRKIFSSPVSGVSVSDTARSSPGICEIYHSTPSSHATPQSDLGFSVLETPDVTIDPEVSEKFHNSFAFDERETLLGYFSGYIFRLLPIYGRLYVSTNYFCFRSSGPLTTKTWMILPIRDILSTEKSRATRFGHHGLIVMVKGHEELFFEFGAEDRRAAFVELLERQIEDMRRRMGAGETQIQSPAKRDALVLEEFVSQTPHSSESEPSTLDTLADSLPAVMFTSGSSTFLTFKPKECIRFTFLTIGSRGDVQPYIALARGLLADGHKVKIATHGEFKEWIESHGIEYGYVGGDPAELMRICVENGTFTVAFLKEGLQKFRGWVDDLLKTSWEACQGTDVLIESPSAMGGYHIAEALGIPYFRAFTMTWTRTRAYPHAFAVPERKMGGGYNYMSYVMFDQVFWRSTSGQINRFRKNILHLGSTSLDKMEPHKIPFLYNFSPVVVPPPLDWPEWIRVTGYWFLDDADVSSKKWQPPPDLVEFIDSAHKLNKKVVYIGFGSIVVSDPKTMTRCVVEAIVQSGVYAVLSKGWSDRLHAKTTDVSEPEVPFPKQVYTIPSIPHDWLFRRIDAACHHGGAGTTGASLRAGIPTIIKPFFGDQFFWADRVEALGVGSGVRKLTVDHLTEALITATTDRKQIDRARLLGEHIRAENGVATAIESIYRDLEYAKSLVKRVPADVMGEDAEDATVRDHGTRSHSRASSSERPQSGNSEDWSVISETDDRRSSFGSGHGEGNNRDRSLNHKRNGLTAAVLSVLPDALTVNTSLRLKPTASRP